MVSTHRKVIEVIHNNREWYDGKAFAIHEVVKESGCSTSSVTRILRQLRSIRYISHTKKAFAGRHYRVTKEWPLKLKDAIENFEYAKILKL